MSLRVRHLAGPDVGDSADASPPDVSVVTLTRERFDLLSRTLESVAEQRGVSIEHIVIGDDCPQLRDSKRLRRLARDNPSVRVYNASREDVGQYLPARLATLRNLGIARSRAPFIAQLDDDNVFEPDHLVSLLECATRSGAEVAHSWRSLWSAAGEPYVPVDCDPWRPDLSAIEAEQAYHKFCSAGILERGSNVVREGLNVSASGDLLPRLDTNTLLISRSLHEELPWPTVFSKGARRMGWTEDTALSVALRRRAQRVVCSEKATVRYFMGGYSTSASSDRHQDLKP